MLALCFLCSSIPNRRFGLHPVPRPEHQGPLKQSLNCWDLAVTERCFLVLRPTEAQLDWQVLEAEQKTHGQVNSWKVGRSAISKSRNRELRSTDETTGQGTVLLQFSSLESRLWDVVWWAGEVDWGYTGINTWEGGKEACHAWTEESWTVWAPIVRSARPEAEQKSGGSSRLSLSQAEVACPLSSLWASFLYWENLKQWPKYISSFRSLHATANMTFLNFNILEICLFWLCFGCLLLC